MDLANAALLEQKRTAMFSGEKINTTENRAVLHVALRAARTAEICVDGINQVDNRDIDRKGRGGFSLFPI